MNAANKLDTEEKKLQHQTNNCNGHQQLQQVNNAKGQWTVLGKSPPDEGVGSDEGNHTAEDGEDGEEDGPENDDDDDESRGRVVLQLKRENTVKDLTQKLAAQNLIPNSPVEEKLTRWVFD